MTVDLLDDVQAEVHVELGMSLEHHLKLRMT